jgi:hypothetical protein
MEVRTMPKLVSATPKYRHHKGSGQAVVGIDGRYFYLGPYGTKTSKREYDRVVGEWLANNRRLPDVDDGDLSIIELTVLYWRFAEQHYRKDGEPTNELNNIHHALRPLKELYCDAPAAAFGPLALKALQVRLTSRVCRRVINQRIGVIKRRGKRHGAIAAPGASYARTASAVETASDKRGQRGR